MRNYRKDPKPKAHNARKGRVVLTAREAYGVRITDELWRMIRRNRDENMTVRQLVEKYFKKKTKTKKKEREADTIWQRWQ